MMMMMMMTRHARLILARHHLHNVGPLYSPAGRLVKFFNFPSISASNSPPLWNIPTRTISSPATVASWAKLNQKNERLGTWVGYDPPWHGLTENLNHFKSSWQS